MQQTFEDPGYGFKYLDQVWKLRRTQDHCSGPHPGVTAAFTLKQLYQILGTNSLGFSQPECENALREPSHLHFIFLEEMTLCIWLVYVLTSSPEQSHLETNKSLFHEDRWSTLNHWLAVTYKTQQEPQTLNWNQL